MISKSISEMIHSMLKRATGVNPRSIQLPTGQSYNPDTYKPARENMKKGGKVSSASKRADGCAVKGKTKGRFV